MRYLKKNEALGLPLPRASETNRDVTPIGWT
jgi:hypothetical protein